MQSAALTSIPPGRAGGPLISCANVSYASRIWSSVNWGHFLIDWLVKVEMITFFTPHCAVSASDCAELQQRQFRTDATPQATLAQVSRRKAKHRSLNAKKRCRWSMFLVALQLTPAGAYLVGFRSVSADCWLLLRPFRTAKQWSLRQQNSTQLQVRIHEK